MSMGMNEKNHIQYVRWAVQSNAAPTTQTKNQMVHMRCKEHLCVWVARVMHMALVWRLCGHDLSDGLVGEVGHCDGWAIPHC